MPGTIFAEFIKPVQIPFVTNYTSILALNLTEVLAAVGSRQRVCYKMYSLRGYILSMFTTEHDFLSRLQYCIASCLGLTRLGTA